MLEEIRGINTRGVVACKRYLNEIGANNRGPIIGYNSTQQSFLQSIATLVQNGNHDAATDLTNRFVDNLRVSIVAPEFAMRSLKLLEVAGRILGS